MESTARKPIHGVALCCLFLEKHEATKVGKLVPITYSRLTEVSFLLRG